MGSKSCHQNTILSSILEGLDGVIRGPELYISPNEQLHKDNRETCKILYDLSMEENDTDDSEGLLDKLYLTGFDSEQVWQQLDHKFNVTIADEHVASLTRLLASASLSLNIDTASPEELSDDQPSDNDTNTEEAVTLGVDIDTDKDDSEDSENGYDDDDLDGEEDMEDEDDKESQVDKKVNDQFFSLQDMNKFLDEQDALLEKDPATFNKPLEELYQSDDEEDPGYKFKEFFAGDKNQKQRTGRVVFRESDNENEEMSDDEMELMKALDREIAEGEEQSESGSESPAVSADERDSEDSDGEFLEDIVGAKKNEPSKSEYEKRTEKLRQRIAAMEEEALQDKTWQMMGEATARTRPQNSLIEEDVEFDSNVAPAPVITMETTLGIEALITQRIKDKAFDDVERKTRLKEDHEKFRKRIEISGEKSQQSLSQIYEAEYLKLRDKELAEEEEKVDPKEEEIKNMMNFLFRKLDALSSFHYTPKEAPTEIKVISSLPAVVVEEVQPATVSDASKLAPEEIKKASVETKDQDEKTETDKNRERRKKKATKRKREEARAKAKARVDKINPGMGNKRAKMRTLEEVREAVVNDSKIIQTKQDVKSTKKTYSSSKEFFKALQNETKIDKAQIRKKAASKPWVNKKTTIAPERLKL